MYVVTTVKVPLVDIGGEYIVDLGTLQPNDDGTQTLKADGSVVSTDLMPPPGCPCVGTPDEEEFPHE